MRPQCDDFIPVGTMWFYSNILFDSALIVLIDTCR
jgi:hypothetical protein